MTSTAMTIRSVPEKAWQAAGVGTLLIAVGFGGAHLLAAEGSSTAQAFTAASRAALFASIPINLRQFLFVWRGRVPRPSRSETSDQAIVRPIWAIVTIGMLVLACIFLLRSNGSPSVPLATLAVVLILGASVVFKQFATSSGLWFVAAAVTAAIAGGTSAHTMVFQGCAALTLVAVALGTRQGLRAGEIQFLRSYPAPDPGL